MNKSAFHSIDVLTYSRTAIPHLSGLAEKNQAVLQKLVTQIVADVKSGKYLLVFGSGHSAVFAMELYHRAGGASFVLPLFGDYLLPSAGPPVVKLMERNPGAANILLARAEPQPGEMLWMCSQSGINNAVIDLALDAKKRGMRTVAFTSVAHSQAVQSRHASGKRLFEVCDDVVDLGGAVGDASIEVAPGVKGGPLSSLGAILLGQSIILAACAELERGGHRCVYTSVNTPEGEGRNRQLEERAMKRDFLLRGY